MRSEPRAALAAGVLWPQWDVAARVGAVMSTRSGGVSLPPWDSLNLGAAVGDDADAVAENRRRFVALTGSVPLWLRQVHGCTVVRASRSLAAGEPPVADAVWADEPGVACIVQVADCIPVLLAAPGGRAVAAVHAGWRGLSGGVVEAALAALCDAAHCPAADVAAWLGPCIGPRSFEVGEDVLRAFGQTSTGADPQRFRRSAAAGDAPRWLTNLPQLTTDRLTHSGVRRISGGRWCTVEQRSRFFSYRRDGVTGRMAAAIWIRP
jgi:YfiH family protein